MSSVTFDSSNKCSKRTSLARAQSEEAATLSEDTRPFATKNIPGLSEPGCLTGNGSGILNMVIVGAISPYASDCRPYFGIHDGFFVPVICYLCILFYALRDSDLSGER